MDELMKMYFDGEIPYEAVHELSNGKGDDHDGERACDAEHPESEQE